MSTRETEENNAEFLAESEEMLARVFTNLSLIEKKASSKEKLDELYRDVHTIKGSSFLFGFNDIGTVSHAMEACLDPVRRNVAAPASYLLEALYRASDLIEKLLQHLGADSQIPSEQITSVVAKLVESSCRQFGHDWRPRPDHRLPLEKNLPLREPGVELTAAIPTVPLASRPASAPAAATVSAPPKAAPAPIAEAKPREPAIPTPEKKISVEKTAATPAVIREEPMSGNQDPKDNEAKATSESSNEATDTSIRVQVALLDKLMNLVGEMVLVRNQVLQYSSRTEDLGFLNLSQRLDLVTTDLQNQVMRTRMQPIGNVVGKFQRMIRDLAKSLGKQVDLTIQGKDTELDKTLLEAIKDPLTHIVRNSCDHGIEDTETRKQAGKPLTGHILVRAFHEGGQVIIEISDDGKGLSRQKIVQKAIEKGLIAASAAGTMADREILGLIFLAGFSTAEKVSSVSGRGVGMDVVRTNIEKIGGSVDLESVEGRGTTIRLRIPLTLAIVPVMLVKSNGATYAIPQVKLVELVRVDTSDNSSNKIQMLQGKPVYELRGKILPLVDLRQVLAGTAHQAGHTPAAELQTANVVVLSAEANLFGLIVDEVLDTADIVVKPLSKFLKSLEVFSAATILGTGDVALILDPLGVAKAAQLTTTTKQEGHFAEAEETSRIKNPDAQEFLLFKTSAPGTYAMPLCLVSRLEELNRSHVEYSGQQPVVQYRGAILPLIDINRVLGFTDKNAEFPEQIPTVVVHRSGKAVGLAVNAIHDVMTSEDVPDDSVKDRFGIMGNLISGDEVVTVIDILGIIEKELAKFLGPDGAAAPVEAPTFARKIKVLYAEDVAFFRRQVAKLLGQHGFEVTTAVDGQAALDLLNSAGAPEFQLILSDIEMPQMNGYEFARAIRQIGRYQKVPMVALTTRFSQRDIDEGLDAGFNCYLEKLNPEVLMDKLQTMIKGAA